MAGISEENTGLAPERNALYPRIVTYTASTAFSTGDVDKIVVMNSGSAMNYTLDTDANVTAPIGATIELVQRGAGAITVVAGGATLIGASLSTAAIGQRRTCRKIAADTWVVSP